MSFHNIPQIDLSPLHASGDQGIYEVAEAVRDIYTRVGFGYIYNHGIEEELINQVFEAAAEFHDLPLDRKMAIVQNKFFRGYMPESTSILKVSTLGKARKPNQSAAFILAHEVRDDDPDFLAQTNLAGPNQWPDNMPGFRDIITNYQTKVLALARKMVQVFSTAFGLQKEALDSYFTQPTTFLRLQYYPEQPDFIPENQFGIAPHTDYGFLTILAQDNRGGLQVKNQQGEWIEAPYIPGTFVLNSSDMLKRMSNDTFLSTPHRVINRSGKKRYSIPFFLEPNMHANIQVLEPFINADNPAKHPSIIYCDHLMKRIRGNYEIGA